MNLFFDIETGPQPADVLADLLPPFDPSEVKCGNIKDPDKIREKIEEARLKHINDFVDKAALNAISGQVLAIGVMTDAGNVQIIGDANQPEQEIIAEFFELTTTNPVMPHLIGFNSNVFDLPYLVRRAWILGVSTGAFCGRFKRGRYWSEMCVDLRETWQLGDRMASGSLDAISRAMGIGQKTGDHGADFYKFWANDRATAIAYLKRDLELTKAMHDRFYPNY